MARREKVVETYLKNLVRAAGGACEKFKSATRGDPDRLLSFPKRYHCLVETKWGIGVEPEPHQLRRHDFWRARGMDVWVVRSKAEADLFMYEMRHHYE